MADVPIDAAALMVQVRAFEKRWLLANHQQPAIEEEIHAIASHQGSWSVTIPNLTAIMLVDELKALREYFELFPPDTMLRILYELKRATSPVVEHPTK